MGAEIVAAGLALCEATLDLLEGPRAVKARAIGKHVKTLRRVLRTRWTQQRGILSAKASKPIRDLFRKVEAARTEEEKDRHRELLVLALAAILAAWALAKAGQVDDGDAEDWDSATAATLIAAAEKLAREFGSVSSIDADAAAVRRFLDSHSYRTIISGIDETTQSRLASAVADVLERGGDYREAADAISGEFDDFLSSRMLTISVFELNAAYNAGRLAEARELGIGGKYWDPDGEACDICIENADAGIIPMDDDFPNGVDAPPQHPNCDCVLMVEPLE